jgi:hypothetical protein
MDFNSLYCSKKCKGVSRRVRDRKLRPNVVRLRRRRSYLHTKQHPDRYDKHLASTRTTQQLARNWLAAYKLSHGCADCGYNAHSAALQLHHTGPKSVEIADARSSIARLQAEIENGKCIVLCANCHSIRTWQQKQLLRRAA